MEIARAAAGLFVRHGLRATRAEDIAHAAGIAPRTFYRYFATKEEAVAPLYAAGADLWAEAVREAPADLSVPQALEHAVRHTLSPGAGVSASSWEWVRTLLRLTEASPGLRRVWAEVCHASERTLAEILAERLEILAERLDRRPTPDADNVAESLAASPELRYAAAVASAAVRTAIETWVAGDAPADGPEGPAGLALRNLGALGDFIWEGVRGGRTT
ncbi:TetR/AcrR family transcriptional regulator [Streptomyces sp. NL15-2K]|uniref:TetR/AcrR family transcriptional regulator n=1 Tax=Streptomyces sp. NL15-2K TaxID=376149 RepID=UPI000F568D52|nr:TetR/AcrR family transcriptional regulator [Streptomyces sp. NL15-2K]